MSISNTSSAIEIPGGIDDLLRTLAAWQRRRLLWLIDQRSPFESRTLALRLIALDGETPLPTLADERVRRTRLELRHVHLPKLREAGLIRPTDEGVTREAHPAWSMPAFLTLVRNDSPAADEVISCLAAPERRAVLLALERVDGTLDREALCHESRDFMDSTPETTMTPARLHHIDLPKLNAADLLAYDPERDTIRAREHPLVPDVLTLNKQFDLLGN